MTLTPDTSTTAKAGRSPDNLLHAMWSSIQYARELTKAGLPDEADRHIAALERYVAEYRAATSSARPAPDAASLDGKPHLLLAGLAQQAGYAYRFAKAGHTAEALEHADAIERLVAAYRAAVTPQTPQPGQEQADCHAGLLPLDDLKAPIERCIVPGKHDVHETAQGRKWTNADAGLEEIDA